MADARVAALAWRPDGKILAVGYDSGVVVLVDVEDANIVHENQFKGCGGLDLSHGSNVASAQSEARELSYKYAYIGNCPFAWILNVYISCI